MTLKKILIFLGLFVFAVHFIYASDAAKPLGKGSIFLSAQFGLNSMAKCDQLGKPFDKQFAPLGGGIEFMLTDTIGLGGTIIYDNWSDYLGMYCGTWDCRLWKPSFDFTYHLRTKKIRAIDVIAGTHLGYSIISVGNEYCGSKPDWSIHKNEPHIAPFIGINLHSWRSSRNFLDRFSINLKAVWSLTGDYSGAYGLIGPAFNIR